LQLNISTSHDLTSLSDNKKGGLFAPVFSYGDGNMQQPLLWIISAPALVSFSKAPLQYLAVVIGARSTFDLAISSM
jgi:hypothetical protein